MRQRHAFGGLRLVGLVGEGNPEEGQKVCSQLQQVMMNLGGYSR